MPSPKPLVALEISTLAERYHTGISNVTKGLARELLEDASVDGRFFFDRSVVPRDVVSQLLPMEGGDILWWMMSRLGPGIPLPYPTAVRPIGIYPNHKWHRRLFPVEVQIVHDLTTILMPQYQTPQAIELWQSRLLGDMITSDLIVTVSESTRIDVETYLPQLAHIPKLVSKLAPSRRGVSQTEELPAEAYVVVLGTLEPRKNIDIVLALLERDSTLLDSAKFVFVGRLGWLIDLDAAVRRHGLQDAEELGRIVFTGFVSDDVRDALIRQARCVLYPSHYEGFGLPILEALSLGTPVITGYGSSLPEAGGDAAIYCDIDSEESLGKALRGVLDDASANAAPARARRKAWPARFNWTATYRRIRDAALELAAK